MRENCIIRGGKPKVIRVAAQNEPKTIKLRNGSKNQFPFLTIGIQSYINELNIQLAENNEVINVHIGNFSSIAYGVQFLVDRNHDYKSISTSPYLEVDRKIPRKGQIIIGHDVWIGNNVTILSGVVIGNGAVIAANTIVTKDIPPYAVVGGNPMKVIKYRFSDDQIQELLNIRWWDWTLEKIDQIKSDFGKGIDQFIAKFKIEKQPKKHSVRMLNAKSTRVLCFPDYLEPYSIWKKIIKEYIESFDRDDDITLILRMEDGLLFNEFIRDILESFEDIDDKADILIVNEPLDEQDLFNETDYYISTRSLSTFQHIYYAEQNNVTILSGVDIPIFKSMNINSKQVD